jgi:predicted ABC-type ATPase
VPNLYIIAGCNGAGKTTASFTVLPEILNCNEFVNADGIAAGLSPFNPESVAMDAGRLMLQRIDQLKSKQVDFAFETTLAARSYVPFIKASREMDYRVTLLYFWLSSPVVAKERVAKRVSMGGHNIPADVIVRRYFAGIRNLINLYVPLCDNWLVINNLGGSPELIAAGAPGGDEELSEKVLKGVRKAVSDLIKGSAEKGEDLVIGNEDGSFKIVPAKDLLPKV